jgi:hypothetical protein
MIHQIIFLNDSVAYPARIKDLQHLFSLLLFPDLHDVLIGGLNFGKQGFGN